MFKSLSNLWSSGPSLNYSVEEPFGSAFGTWIHYTGKSKEDESEVSVFKMQCSDVLDPRMIAAKNGVKRLRTIKHPNVLEFKDSLELEQGEKSGGEPVIYLVTEPVKPLKQVLRELNLDSTAKEQYLSWGLHQITKAVSFLSNDCKLIHGNVCLDAIVVTEQLDWKLHGFDMLTEYDQADAYDSPLKLYSNTVAEQYKCEEVRKGDYALVKRSPPWAVDSWGLGCLVQELFRGGELSKMDELRDTKVIPPVVLKDYTRLLGSNPNKRLNPAKLLETNEFFMNKLVDTIRFLEDLNLKDSAEKENYFRRLPIVLETLVDAIAQKKVLPLLAKALEFGSAPAVALDPLLQIAKTVPSDEYPGKVVPCLVKLYASTDRQIRTTLLTNMDNYIEHMSPTVVDEQVFPNLASGFTDATPFLRELTLKSTLALAPKLSQRTINQNLLKHLAKLQVDEEAAIRANTTICLGNIARYLSEAAAKRVLLNAFTRALRDQFAPARAAGLMAITATMGHYDADEAARRIIPAVAPLCVDLDVDVRSKSFDLMDTVVKLLREHSQSAGPGEQLINAKLISSDTGGDGGEGNSGGGLLGWTLSSLTGTRVKKPDQTTKSGGAGAAAAENAGSGVEEEEQEEQEEQEEEYEPEAPAPAPARESRRPRPNARAAPTRQREPPTPQLPQDEEEDADGDGWGDLEDDLAAEQEEAAARSRLSAVRPARSAATRSAPTPKLAPMQDDRHMDEDGEDDGWGDIDVVEEKPAPKPVPKPKPTLSAARSASSGVGRARPAPKPREAAAKKPMKLGVQKVNADGFDWGSFLDEDK